MPIHHFLLLFLSSQFLAACGENAVFINRQDEKISSTAANADGFALHSANPRVNPDLFSVTGEGVFDPKQYSSTWGYCGSYREGNTHLAASCSNGGLAPKILGIPGSRYIEFANIGNPTASGNDRTELALGTMIPFDRTYYVSFDFRMPSSSSVNSNFLYAMQFWQCAPLSPIAGVRILSRNIMNFMVRHQNNPSATTVGQFTMSLDKWYSIVMGVQPNPAGNGKIEVWVDGSKIVDQRLPFGSNTKGHCLDNSGAPNMSHRVKFGIYKGSEAGVFNTNFDNVTGGFSTFLNPIPTSKPSAPSASVGKCIIKGAAGVTRFKENVSFDKCQKTCDEFKTAHPYRSCEFGEKVFLKTSATPQPTATPAPKKDEEDKRKKDEEDKKKAEEDKKKADEAAAKKKAEDDARKKAEEDKKKADEAAAKKKAEDDARKKAEEDKKKADEAAKKKAEEDKKKKAEEDKKKKDEEDKRKKDEEDKKKKKK